MTEQVLVHDAWTESLHDCSKIIGRRGPRVAVPSPSQVHSPSVCDIVTPSGRRGAKSIEIVMCSRARNLLPSTNGKRKGRRSKLDLTDDSPRDATVGTYHISLPSAHAAEGSEDMEHAHNRLLRDRGGKKDWSHVRLHPVGVRQWQILTFG